MYDIMIIFYYKNLNNIVCILFLLIVSNSIIVYVDFWVLLVTQLGINSYYIVVVPSKSVNRCMFLIKLTNVKNVVVLVV